MLLVIRISLSRLEFHDAIELFHTRTRVSHNHGELPVR
jgi:hypothetical protein